MPGYVPGTPPELPAAARRLKPTLRERVLADALQAARLDNAGSDVVLAYFDLFCRLVGDPGPAPALPGAPPLRVTEWEVVDQFARETCQEAPGASLWAATIHRAFQRWWRREKRPCPMPSQHVFGRALAQHFPKRKTGGHVRYYDVLLDPTV